MSEPLLKVDNLTQHFPISRTFTVKAVNGVSFEIWPGETYGLVGESGSGKTTIGRSIIRLHNPTSGSVKFQGKEIAGRLDRETERMLRRDMQMIFQDPMSSLNPRKKVGDIIGEGLDIHHRFATSKERDDAVSEMLKKVGLSTAHAERYPHQFSGGQRQRVGIARALVMNPKLIIADECISALDVSIQAQVVNLMKDIQAEIGCAYLFIAHDLSMSSTSPTASACCIWATWSRRVPPRRSSRTPCTRTPRACCPPCRCPTPRSRSAATRWPTTASPRASTTPWAPSTSSGAPTPCSPPTRSSRAGPPSRPSGGCPRFVSGAGGLTHAPVEVVCEASTQLEFLACMRGVLC